ncbi:DUF5132 domain-containing protein [Streptomyces hirsutus]|uniref:DUF5132 domain-containing protein n=1 Tax=Streptomyces hirsutus TaxID=35620 RepID=UPI003440AC23
MPPVVPPFLIGLIAAPLAKRLMKPLVRGVVKTSVGLVMEVKRAASEAGENMQDLAAEATAEMIAAQVAHDMRKNPHGEAQSQVETGSDGAAASRTQQQESQSKSSVKPRAAAAAAKD